MDASGRTRYVRRARSRRSGNLPTFLLVLLLFASLGYTLPAAGGGAGVFEPPHSDVGVDTNGDRAFNYLRIDVGVDITSPGSFTIRMVLKDDLDLATMTSTAVVSTLAAGRQRIAVALIGSDIYAGGVDGPYFAHLSLVDAFGVVLSTDIHMTAAYRFTDFQPFDARFVPPISERTIDEDADGLVNSIAIRFIVEVATEGRYRLSSHLTDGSYQISEDVATTRVLVPGRYDWDVLFPAYPLRLAARSGPYLATNSLYDPRGVLIDFAFVETRAYSYTSLETPPGWFASSPTVQAIDSDGDGLFNSLGLKVPLGFEGRGNYTLSGRLFTGAGALVADTVARLNLATGTYIAALSFDGSAIFAAGVDGPYRIDVQLYDEALRKLDVETVWTAAYRRLDFQPRLLYFDPPHADIGIDDDRDGKFDVLRLQVGVFFNVAGSARIVAGLGQGRLSPNFTDASVAVDMLGGPHVVNVDFGGAALLAAGIAGSFHVRLSAFDVRGNLVDTTEFYTHEYALSDFEAPPRGRILGLLSEWGEDTDGDGLHNRLRFQVQANATSLARYRLEGILSSGPTSIATTSTVVSLDETPSTVPLLFSGKEVRAASLNGPYDLTVAMTQMEGGELLDSAVFVSSAYAVALFETATPATLSGRVTSRLDGTAMENATVWLVSYADHVSRAIATDSSGLYGLPAFVGAYWLIVDDPAAQAQVAPVNLTGANTVDASLWPSQRMGVEADLVWTGWDTLLLRVRHLYEEDGPAMPFRFDWWNGNRDGWVQPLEVQGLPRPLDPLRDALERGDTDSRLRVDGVEYIATDAVVSTDGLSGTVDPFRSLVVTTSRSFASQLPIGSPSEVTISLEALYDNVTMDYGIWLYVPGAYRYATATASYGVRVFARTIPYLVDPRLLSPSEGSFVTGAVDIDLIPQSHYGEPAPAAPFGVSAAVSGEVVSLTWLRPLENLDGGPLTNLAGYRVYRATEPLGPYPRADGQLVLSEAFTDAPGAGTFYYVVTALNTDGIEGPPSSAVRASVPSSSGTGGAVVSPSVDDTRLDVRAGTVHRPLIAVILLGTGAALTLAWIVRTPGCTRTERRVRALALLRMRQGNRRR